MNVRVFSMGRGRQAAARPLWQQLIPRRDKGSGMLKANMPHPSFPQISAVGESLVIPMHYRWWVCQGSTDVYGHQDWT